MGEEKEVGAAKRRRRRRRRESSTSPATVTSRLLCPHTSLWLFPSLLFSSLLYQLIGFVVMMRKSLMHLMHLMHLLITFVAVFSLSSSGSHVAATCLTSTMTAG